MHKPSRHEIRQEVLTAIDKIVTITFGKKSVLLKIVTGVHVILYTFSSFRFEASCTFDFRHGVKITIYIYLNNKLYVEVSKYVLGPYIRELTSEETNELRPFIDQCLSDWETQQTELLFNAIEGTDNERTLF